MKYNNQKYIEDTLSNSKGIVVGNDDVYPILTHRKTMIRIPVDKTMSPDTRLISLRCIDGKIVARFDDYSEWMSRYNVGDVLYIKESVRSPECARCNHIYCRNQFSKPSILSTFNSLKVNDKLNNCYDYKADYVNVDNSSNYRFSPAIAMPKEAARIFIQITDVRLQRLNAITHKQAIREGSNYNVPILQQIVESTKSRFINKWNNKYGKRNPNMKYENNPYVWVYTFEVIYTKK